MAKRVMVGSCGGLTGCYLARQFRKMGGVAVIGADRSAHNVTQPFLDEFAILPDASSPEFRNELAEVLNRYEIDCYLPTHSCEIRAVAKHEAWLRRMWNGNFLVSPYETHLKLDSKRVSNENLRRIGVPVPILIEKPGSGVVYPVFMKPDEGSGSRRAQAVQSEILHREYARLYPDCSFYQFIRGTEYTVDCVFDERGQLLAYNQRMRLKNMGGGAIVTQNNYDFDVLPYLKKIEDAFVIKGCVNFQYILSEGIPYFTDINLRYASGGLPLTVESGIDVPRIFLDIWAGKPLDYVRSCGADRKTMYRYFEEWYEMP